MTKRHARIIGLIYLLFFVASMTGEALLKGLVAKNDAATTASNILTQESLFRLGIATALAGTGFYVALIALFYRLFKPVSPNVSLVAAFFGVVGCAIQAGGNVFQLFSLAVLRNDQSFVPV